MPLLLRPLRRGSSSIRKRQHSMGNNDPDCDSTSKAAVASRVSLWKRFLVTKPCLLPHSQQTIRTYVSDDCDLEQEQRSPPTTRPSSHRRMASEPLPCALYVPNLEENHPGVGNPADCSLLVMATSEEDDMWSTIAYQTQQSSMSTDLPSEITVDSSACPMKAEDCTEDYWEELEREESLYERAVKLADQEKFEAALNECEKLENSNELLQVKAQILGRMGCYEESLQTYQQLLKQEISCADKCNTLYACGRLSVQLQLYRQAIDFYSKELELTLKIVSQKDMTVSRIYHELARIAHQGLADGAEALQYYQRALDVELAVWKHSSGRERILVTKQIQETKREMGRIHFENGEFDKAVQCSLKRI